MRNIIAYYHAVVVLWILSLTKAESSGSKDGFGKKSGFDSTYTEYLGEYAGHLSAGKALGELHGFSETSQLPPEHGSDFEDGESHNFSESFGEQGDNEDSSHFERYSESFESLKFPQDVEAQHYSGGASSDTGLENNKHHHLQHQHHHHRAQHHFENNHNSYQFDEPAKSSEYKGYHSFEGIQIVPYSGSEETEQHEEPPPQYSGYDPEENELTKSPAKSYEAPAKAPASSNSYSSEASKPSAASYSHSYEGSKTSSNSHSFEASKPLAASYSSHSFEGSKASKASPTSYSHFYEISKPSSANSHHSNSYDSSKIPASSTYSHSFESLKPSSSTYESYKSPSLSSHEPSLESYRTKYQHASAQEPPPKYKSSSLKDFHSPLQKNIMTINHGKGGYSFSSLYRS